MEEKKKKRESKVKKRRNRVLLQASVTGVRSNSRVDLAFFFSFVWVCNLPFLKVDVDLTRQNAHVKKEAKSENEKRGTSQRTVHSADARL